MRSEVHYDGVNDETFARVVGRRERPAIGTMPSPEARAAMAQMAAYRTAAPKGIFRYRTHEEANRDREAWTVQHALACIDEQPDGVHRR